MDVDAQMALDAQSTLSQIGAFLIDMGISPSELFAGMWGALFGIVLLGVPARLPEKQVKKKRASSGSAAMPPAQPAAPQPYWCKRTETIAQALTVTVLSAVMAAYMTPILLDIAGVSVKLQSAQKGANMFAFMLGAGGRVFLQKLLHRYLKRIDDAPFFDVQKD